MPHNDNCSGKDEFVFRSPTGCDKWQNVGVGDNMIQKYTGRFLYNNLHHNGIYFIETNSKNRWCYNGKFYCNKMEGYGQVIYGNGSNFEGLFKDHSRFGPGILTNVDRTNQSVGLWDGFTLIRLCTVVSRDCVPKLGVTDMGRSQLLKFRKFVPLPLKKIDLADKILKDLNANEQVLSRKNELYHPGVRKPRSLFFNRSKYDEVFFTQDDCTIEVEVSEEQNRGELNNQDLVHEEVEQFISTEIESADGNCNCYDVHRDKFTQICVQLHEIELKLNDLDERKTRSKEQRNRCRSCCRKRQKHLQKYDDIRNILLEVLKRVAEGDTNAHGRNLNSTVESAEDYQLELFNIDTTSNFTQDSKEVDVFMFPSSLSIDESIDSTNTQPFAYEESHASNLEGKLREIGDIFEKFNPPPPSPSPTIKLMFVNDGKSDPGTKSSSQSELIQVDYAQTSIKSSLPSTSSSSSSSATEASDICTCHNYGTSRSRDDLDAIKQEEIFYKAIHRDLKSTLNREFDRNRIEVKKSTKKIQVTDLIAWNNEITSMRMMQHCFLHRKSESNISFNIADVLTGRRNEFKPADDHEKYCMNFLEYCAEGHDRNAFRLLREHNLNPDLCDARGNTGIMLASAEDRINVITILVNCGGKIDSINDEGLTPLSMTLLRLLTIKLRVYNWEKGFLLKKSDDVTTSVDDIIDQELSRSKWRLRESSLNLIERRGNQSRQSMPFNETEHLHGVKEQLLSYRSSIKEMMSGNRIDFSSSDHFTNVKDKLNSIASSSKIFLPGELLFDHKITQKYVLDTEYKRLPIETAKTRKKSKKNKRRKKKKSLKRHTKKNSRSTSSKKSSADLVESKAEFEAEQILALKQEMIKKTILVVLGFGADPNTAQVPLPPLILSIFTNDCDLVHGILENRANPDVATSDEKLTSLHILASLKPQSNTLSICKMLLKYGADPNLKTNSYHWEEQTNEILESDRADDDNGKSALHLLCIREDFDCDPYNQLQDLAKLLIRPGNCDTNDLYLGHTPLSLSVLKANTKLVETLLQSDRVDAYTSLGFGMGNALTVLILKKYEKHFTPYKNMKMIDVMLRLNVNPFDEVGDFANVFHFIENEQLGKESPRKQTKKKKKKTISKSKKKKSPKRTKKSPKSCFDITTKYLLTASRNFLIKHIQTKITAYLYIFISENLTNDHLIENLARLVTPLQVVDCLKEIFQHERLPHRERIDEKVVLDLMDFVNNQNDAEEFSIELKSILSFVPSKSNQIRPSPGVDRETKKYKVCFQCLKHSRLLLRCPECELIYFCSQKCNDLNNTTCTFHKCQSSFYDDEIQKIPQRSKLANLLEMANLSQKTRLVQEELNAMESRTERVRFKSFATNRKLFDLRSKVSKLRNDTENYARSRGLFEFGDGFDCPEEKDLEVVSICPFKSDLDIGRTQFGKKVKPSKRPHYRTVEGRSRSIIEGLSGVGSLFDQFGENLMKSITNEVVNDSRRSVNFDKSPKKSTSCSTKFKTKESRDYGNVRILKDVASKVLSRSESQRLETLLGKRKSTTSRASANYDKDHFMNLLTRAFADFNLPLLLLPYACYKEGQGFYIMQDKPYFQKMFNRLSDSM